VAENEDDVEKARTIYSRADTALKENSQKEEVMLLRYYNKQ